MATSARGQIALLLTISFLISPLYASVDKEAIDKKLAAIVSYERGMDRQPLIAVEELIRRSQGRPEQRKYVEQRLAALLEKATLEGKSFICKQLWSIGTAESVPAVAKLLTDEQTADMACYAIGQNPSAEAGKALRDALDKTSPKVQIRIIALLGDRRDTESVGALAALVFSADTQLGEAAVTALGKIGGTAARKALARARAKGNADLKSAATDAYLRCAEELAARGHREEAVAMYKELAGEDEAAIVRSAAIRGMADVGREKATPFVIAALHDENRMLKMAAMSCVREMLGLGVTERIAAELPKLPPSDQVLLIGALTNREDRAALPAITKAVSSTDVEVRTAAMYGLAYFSDTSCVEMLVRAIESDTPKERKAAIFALQNIDGTADTAIEKFMQNSQPAVRSQLIEVLADRHAVGAVPTLLVESANPDPKVRRAAFKALGRLANQKDLPALVKLLVNSPRGASRDAEKAVVAVSRKIVDENMRADVVLAALSAEKRIPVRCSLMRVLGGIANNKALDTLATASQHSDPTLKDVAVRTLAQWPNGSAAKVLLEIYGDSQNKVHRLLALRGFARLLALPPGDRPAAESLELCRRAMGKTRSTDEKKLVLSGLGNVAHPGALTMVEPFLENETVRPEAVMAATKIARAIAQTHPEKARATLNKVLSVAEAPHLRRQAQETLRQIEQAQNQ